MSSPSMTKSPLPIRKKRQTGRDIEMPPPPSTGNVSVIVNVVLPTEIGGPNKGASYAAAPWMMKLLRYCFEKVWTLIRP